MKNPFQYSNVVIGHRFCNRQIEVQDLGRAMENGERLFVYSERRLLDPLGIAGQKPATIFAGSRL